MKLSTVISPFALVLALGCGSSAPSSQLVDARRAYDQARMSEASTLAPARVMTAKQALDRAERAHADDAGSFKEKSLAYVAQRESELAQAYANLAKAERDRQQAGAMYTQRQDELRRRAQTQAQSAEQNLTTARQAIAAQGSALNEEHQARTAAEKRAAAAMASLAEVAKVKEESRGTVITLDGSVLFISGKSDLLPVAREKLDSVAKALSDLDDDQSVVIEGHTDSKGPDDANMRLSQARADSVREYLLSRGAKPDRIRAVGRGEQQPLATNDSPEGRANNRRVEIIIQPSQRNGAAQPQTGTSTR